MATRPLCKIQILLMAVSFVQVTQSVPLNRHKRHSDSVFTSELSKVRGTAVARSFLNSILGTQTSSSLSSSPGKVKRHLSDIEDTAHPGSSATLQNILELLSALQVDEGSKENALSLRNHEVSTMLSKLLRLHSLQEQPCMRWFHSYYQAMSIFSGDFHLPVAAPKNHQTCTIIRQLLIKLQIQAFLSTIDLQ